MLSVRTLYVGLGFILTAFMLSPFLPEHFNEVALFKNQIFRTNCLLIFGSGKVKDGVGQLPHLCGWIQDLIPVTLLVNGILVLIFGVNKVVSIISILNLTIFGTFYCNPLIDSSFKSFSHFLKVAIAIGIFFIIVARNQEKKHRD